MRYYYLLILLLSLTVHADEVMLYWRTNTLSHLPVYAYDMNTSTRPDTQKGKVFELPRSAPPIQIAQLPAIVDTELGTTLYAYEIGTNDWLTLFEKRSGVIRTNLFPALTVYQFESQKDRAKADRIDKESNPSSSVRNINLIEITKQIEAILERLERLEQ